MPNPSNDLQEFGIPLEFCGCYFEDLGIFSFFLVFRKNLFDDFISCHLIYFVS